ncbi:g548 [Coccomyxa viridis]|uniref:G548 protein n=1 Tax=Coccomyxa viridis TaxID=1274662 RepID=A0ABP1FHZ6_9CHLO
MQLDDDVIRTFGIGRIFKDSAGRVNSLDFHRSEEVLITAGDDDSIRTYNTLTGEPTKSVYSRKYGVANICCTHDPMSVIYTSTKGRDHGIRYHTLHDNKYIRYFTGHTERVTGLCICPSTDLFISSSEDCAVRMWDLRSMNCEGLLETPAKSAVAFDQQGLIFAVATNNGLIRLYDSKNYQAGPFSTFLIDQELNNPASISSVTFSNDGKLMAVSLEGRVYLLDALEGNVQARFDNGLSLTAGPALEASFSPDSRYLISGTSDHSIAVWSIEKQRAVAQWTGLKALNSALKWSPRRMLVASADSVLALWVPNKKLLQSTGRWQGP